MQLNIGLQNEMINKVQSFPIGCFLKKPTQLYLTHGKKDTTVLYNTSIILRWVG